ncbi:MAG TPA: hypothetical protein VK435_03075 [Thermodesulfovibrionales bacterium]|nr:hypothetical protein [Thermodesulfovibrionales bacterium]
MKNQLKYLQNLFYDLLNDYGRVYVMVRYSDKTIIGKRGFTDEERKNGLVLIFNSSNFKDLEWDEDGGITALLGFGAANRPERCFLYHEDIVSVFSPDARVKYDRFDIWESEVAPGKPEDQAGAGDTKSGENIVSLDRFRKTKK